jgi:hypothetical protein
MLTDRHVRRFSGQFADIKRPGPTPVPSCRLTPSDRERSGPALAKCRSAVTRVSVHRSLTDFLMT